MTEPTRLFADQQPGPGLDDLGPTFVEMAKALSAICATRVLLMICVLTGAGIWSYVCWDPSRERLYAAIAFSLVFVGPQVALYWRRG